jgi:predicted AAA+ superfamily ATPase
VVAKRLYPRITRPSEQPFFLFGVRGVGKSTWARHQFPQARRIDLLDEGRYQSLLADPELFADELRPRRPGDWVIVDEVQRIPGLLNYVHQFIEERGLRFVLLGSSARKLKTGGTNLLAGRALWNIMYPLVPEELGRDFNLDTVLRYGTIPLVWTSLDRAQTLESYVHLYLREEIRAESLVRNLPGFVRFLPIAALCHGQVVNISGIARDSGTARTTVSGYLEILEDTLLASRLPAFEARLRVRERKHPKLYWTDPGLVRAVKKQLGPVTEEEKGALFEGWMFILLKAYAEARGLYEEVFYWAPSQSSGLEVGFLLRRGRELLALEAKAARRFSRSWLGGLKAIGDLDGVVRRVIVHPGPRALETAGGIEVWSLAEFLERLVHDTLWP